MRHCGTAWGCHRVTAGPHGRAQIPASSASWGPSFPPTPSSPSRLEAQAHATYTCLFGLRQCRETAVAAGSVVPRTSVVLLCCCTTVHKTLRPSGPQGPHRYSGSTRFFQAELENTGNLASKQWQKTKPQAESPRTSLWSCSTEESTYILVLHTPSLVGDVPDPPPHLLRPLPVSEG